MFSAVVSETGWPRGSKDSEIITNLILGIDLEINPRIVEQLESKPKIH